MTAAELIAERIAPFWLPTAEIAGDAASVAIRTLSRRYRKAESGTLTQFNTGGIVVRPDRVLALTECKPNRGDATVEVRPPAKSRALVIDDIRRHGPPLLAVLFAKGALDIAAWICCTDDEVVLNGPAGPEETAAMEDVVFVHGLPGSVRAWRDVVARYRAAKADLSQASALYAATDKLAAANGMAGAQVLEAVHRLHRVSNLSFALAETGQPSG